MMISAVHNSCCTVNYFLHQASPSSACRRQVQFGDVPQVMYRRLPSSRKVRGCSGEPGYREAGRRQRVGGRQQRITPRMLHAACKLPPPTPPPPPPRRQVAAQVHGENPQRVAFPPVHVRQLASHPPSAAGRQKCRLEGGSRLPSQVDLQLEAVSDCDADASSAEGGASWCERSAAAASGAPRRRLCPRNPLTSTPGWP